MTEPNEDEFVQIPTMTFRKPKKKQVPTRAIIIGITIMGIGLVILVFAILFLL